jgi:membrane-bound lytic murein transglycosylase B
VIAGASVATSLAAQAINPLIAVPSIVKYEKRPLLMQVDPKEFARELLKPADFKCFNKLMSKESAWADKKNPTSSAEGVGQLLDSTVENLGMKRGKSRVSQTVAALSYIGRKYGSGGACKAWAFFQRNNYY